MDEDINRTDECGSQCSCLNDDYDNHHRYVVTNPNDDYDYVMDNKYVMTNDEYASDCSCEYCQQEDQNVQ